MKNALHTGFMAEVLLFHHAHGLTEGLQELADRLRAAGHTVHTPDCFMGLTFTSLDEGLTHAERIGHDAVLEVALRAARNHHDADVTLGFSMGALQAQYLAQHVRRIKACALMGGAIPPELLGSPWRPHVALQVHMADPDDWCPPQDLLALERSAPHAQVHRYRHARHMFVDPSLHDYDADAADTFEERLTSWLAQF